MLRWPKADFLDVLGFQTTFFWRLKQPLDGQVEAITGLPLQIEKNALEPTWPFENYQFFTFFGHLKFQKIVIDVEWF